MDKPTFSLGIDLGTSNSAMTLAPVDDENNPGELVSLPITQVLGPNSVGERDTMPSALYFPTVGEFEDDAVAFAGTSKRKTKTGEQVGEYIIGHFAREAGAARPDRLIVSAKSWLCNKHVNPRDTILPWQSASIPPTERFSPLGATHAYLEHLKESFLLHGKAHKATLKATHLILTVPASFDEVARQLTREAAEGLGFAEVSLMEEPQAAFYSWLEERHADWREEVKPGDLMLVCDVGGGTSDFSLIAVSENDGNLELERVSVGEHILLGGDNVDLALAYFLRQQLEDEGTAIDDPQFLALIHSCKAAKETLLCDESLEQVPVAIAGRGASLVSSAITTQLPRAALNQILFEGFLPVTEVTELPEARGGVGLREFGLAFEQDPVLSKHLAAFLTRSHDIVASHGQLAAKMPAGTLVGSFLKPTAVLFNGGFFKSAQVRQRVLDLLAKWSPASPPRELEGSKYDLAVANGACYYGLHKLTGKGVRIRAGAARSYYIGLETSMLAVPGIKPKVKAVCVVPQGMEEGTETILNDQQFGLVLGQEVRFRFFSSASRAGEQTGSIVADADRELEETAALAMHFEPLDGMKLGEVIPVKLHCRVSEMGTLELWMQDVQNDDNQWKLEFNVRTA